MTVFFIEEGNYAEERALLKSRLNVPELNITVARRVLDIHHELPANKSRATALGASPDLIGFSGGFRAQQFSATEIALLLHGEDPVRGTTVQKFADGKFRVTSAHN